MQFGLRNVFQLIRWGESHLVTNGVPNARRNAEWLLAHVLGCRSADLYLNPQRVLTAAKEGEYAAFVERRGMREPLQYVIGITEFMSLPFYSSRGVFIPRPDTEVLAERAEALLADVVRKGEIKVLDLCCGSGVIAVSLLKRVPRLRVTAVDANAIATALTVLNAELNQVHGRLDCVVSSAGGFLIDNRTCFDAIVCNPPYVPRGDIGELPPEISLHEPRESLDGGEDGLDFYRNAIPLLGESLKRGAVVAFEIGSSQGTSVANLLAVASFVDIDVHQDYAGLDRVITARFV